MVASELQEEDAENNILFITSKKKSDISLIKKKNFKFKVIYAGKLRRYFSLSNVFDIFLIFIGFFQSFFIIRRFNPDIIFSKGSYVSLPVVIAGRILGKKIIIHESDSFLGLSNRLSLRFADRLGVSFSLDHYKYIGNNKTFFSGNPIRRLNRHEFKDRKNILIMGGSQGAKSINEAVFKILKKLIDNGFKVFHLTGDLDYKKAIEIKEKNNFNNYYPVEGVYDEEKYGNLLSEASIIISRAGSTLFEIAAFSKPCILIPLPGHQEKNSRVLAKANAVIEIKNDDLTPENLYQKILQIDQNKELQEKLSNNIKTFYHPLASQVIIKEIKLLAVK